MIPSAPAPDRWLFLVVALLVFAPFLLYSLIILFGNTSNAHRQALKEQNRPLPNPLDSLTIGFILAFITLFVGGFASEISEATANDRYREAIKTSLSSDYGVELEQENIRGFTNGELVRAQYGGETVVIELRDAKTDEPKVALADGTVLMPLSEPKKDVVKSPAKVTKSPIKPSAPDSKWEPQPFPDFLLKQQE